MQVNLNQSRRRLYRLREEWNLDDMAISPTNLISTGAAGNFPHGRSDDPARWALHGVAPSG